MAVRWPVTVMVARTAATIPVGERWRYEPKADGFRCVAIRTAEGRVQLQSRQQRPLIAAFPDIVDILAERLPPGTVVDGELVLMTGARIDFQALQRRLASRRVDTPATLVVFDYLSQSGVDLRPLPQAQRRDRLEQLITTSGTGLALMPATADPLGAAAWMHHGAHGIEGVVSKRADQGYLPSRNSWSKTKAKNSVEAIVGGVLGSPRAPQALILGRYDRRGRLLVIGRSFPLRSEASAAVAAALTQPTGPHPWPTVLPGGRFGLPGSDPVEHTPVAPTLVVEIEADTNFELGRYRHGVKFVRIRAELHPEDVSVLV
jgi:ATP-dependent DNA ligase